MRSTILFSCLLAGSSLFSHRTHEFSTATSSSLKSTKENKTASAPIGAVRIVIDKSSYELQVYDAKGWYATYPVVFGNNTLADKCMEGDRCTPEGTFHIANKRPHEKWSRYMGLDYPNKESLARFAELKRRGIIPKKASPGGGVGIHGTWPHDDYMIDRYSNWTNGCISLKNGDMQELYSYVPIGTPVTIRR